MRQAVQQVGTLGKVALCQADTDGKLDVAVKRLSLLPGVREWLAALVEDMAGLDGSGCGNGAGGTKQ